ncbi:MAG TPA: malto-oligosyltrehalose synthase [Thermoanaerobaculia bacterium]|nr:malto-oligosyltrehalose synthase [Thermoanaerobaculia bacterium]
MLSSREAWLREGRATYRVQLRDGVTLDDAATWCADLAALGITDLYLSPIQRARSGSAHGYDVVDPAVVDEAIGGVEALRRLSREARTHGLRLLLDVVPNHMAASAGNRWWWDVLRWGRRSRFACHFDIDWRRGPGERIVLPRLGEPFERALEHLDLVVGEDGLVLESHGEPLAPLRPASWKILLGSSSPSPTSSAEPTRDAPEDPWLARLDADPPSDEPELRLVALYREGGAFGRRVDRALSMLRGRAEDEDAQDEARLDLWRRLLMPQHWSLELWRSGLEHINYRRFFDIADLVALRADREEVFRDEHALVLDLCADGTFAGLRIDHVDGLLDPEGYLERLGEALEGFEADPYVLVEKILASDEELPESWRCSGTTGYELANAITAVLTPPDGFTALCRGWRRFVGSEPEPERALRAGKREVLRSLFVAEVEALLDEIVALPRGGSPELDRDAWRVALCEITAALDVYRTYLPPGSQDAPPRHRPEDLERLESASRRARESLERGEVVMEGPQRQRAVQALDELDRLLRLDLPRLDPAQPDREGVRAADENELLRRAEVVQRWQQLTGPAMAKGLEDTLLYRLPVLGALCEVGGEPAGVAPLGDREAFHCFQRQRAGGRPGSLSATSTHDTKRSEDLRARLLVLAELGDEWVAIAERWSERHGGKKRQVEGRPAPSPAEEWLLYQSLVGIWPARRRDDDLELLKQRLGAYAVKAAREAKENTSWLDPDAGWEAALESFVEAVLADAEQQRELDTLIERVGPLGAWTALSQLVLKLGVPGICDVYQGCELWSLALVDPDNRRPVDPAGRSRLLDELERRASADGADLLDELVADWPSGAIKLWVTQRGLLARRRHAALSAAADYLPLEAAGARSENVCAFARRAGSSWVVVVASRWIAGLAGDGRAPIGDEIWADTMLGLPDGAPRSWKDVLACDAAMTAEGRDLPLATILQRLPVALLVSAESCR